MTRLRAYLIVVSVALALLATMALGGAAFSLAGQPASDGIMSGVVLWLIGVVLVVVAEILYSANNQ